MPDMFSYQQFHVSEDHRTVSFEYSVVHGGQAYYFTERLIFPVPLLDTPAQAASLRALHVALGISYYKIFCSPALQHPYRMNPDEVVFWNSVWRNGLGEFLYINKLSPSILATFTAQAGVEHETTVLSAATERALLGIGGGKDSIVSGEALKRCNVPLEGFVMATGEQRGQAQLVADMMNIPLHAVQRTLDAKLLTVQELPGAHKGHVPISLVFALVGTALAIAHNAAYVAIGNEASSSIPRHTGEYGSVNHQWSKSFEAECAIQEYIHRHISPSITYFSVVRQLTSVGVAKLFAKYPQYFEIFTSDNSVFRIDPAQRPNGRWSLESPKSLSSFILLMPWLSKYDMLRIFSANLLDEPSLESLFWELTGQIGEPPLDCVGTVKEILTSLNIAAMQHKFTDSYLMDKAQKRGIIVAKDWQTDISALLKLQPEEALPAQLKQVLNDGLQTELNT